MTTTKDSYTAAEARKILAEALYEHNVDHTKSEAEAENYFPDPAPPATPTDEDRGKPPWWWYVICVVLLPVWLPVTAAILLLCFAAALVYIPIASGLGAAETSWVRVSSYRRVLRRKVERAMHARILAPVNAGEGGG